MKIVFWNIRGLNGKSKHVILINLFTHERPTIIMLQETKCSNEPLSSLAFRIWQGSGVVVTDALGVVEGLDII
jgi:exonuclease III